MHLPQTLLKVTARRERRKDARPGELLDAALDLFVEKGFAATSAAQVAQRAGVSKGTLFLYFASKEDLFKEVVRTNISSHYPAWHETLQTFSGSTPDMLRLCVQGWWASVGNTKASGISKLMMSEGANFPDLSDFYRREVMEPGNALIRSILQRGVDRGEFGPIDMKYGVYTVLAPMLFLVMWKHSFASNMPNNVGFVPEAYLSAHVESLLHGLCLRASDNTQAKPIPVTPKTVF
jgi:TetR/AcrR family transcriptional regulator